jgi:hypothetical protein
LKKRYEEARIDTHRPATGEANCHPSFFFALALSCFFFFFFANGSNLFIFAGVEQ